MVDGVGRRVTSAANFARHKDRYRVWDPEGGRGLDLAERPWVDGMLRGLSDQRAKVLKHRCGNGRWRTTAPNTMNARRVNWERLKEEEKKDEFVRKTVEKMEERGELGEGEV